MQNTDTAKERREAIRKAYAEYLRLMDDIDTLDNARNLYKRTIGRFIPGYYDVLNTILMQRRTLESTIINKVKEYFEEYANLEILEKYLNGLIGPSAHIAALSALTGEEFA